MKPNPDPEPGEVATTLIGELRRTHPGCAAPAPTPLDRINTLLSRYQSDPIAREVVRALGVVALTPAIRAFLLANDPMALRQIDRALAPPPAPPL